MAGLMCFDVMGDHSEYLCVPPAGACGIERPHGERRAVLPLTSVPRGCFWNRASTWGMANSCVTTYVSTGCLWNRALTLRMANFVTASFSGGSASPLVHMLVLSKTVSVTLFGAREALSVRL